MEVGVSEDPCLGHESGVVDSDGKGMDDEDVGYDEG